MTQLYVQQLRRLFQINETEMFNNAKGSASSLFAWTASKVLLGEEAQAGLPMLQAQIANFAPTNRPNIDLGEWTFLLATKELLEDSSNTGYAEARQLLASYTEIDIESHRIVQSALALSVLNGDDVDAQKWFKLGIQLSLEKYAELYNYELLFLAQQKLTLEKPYMAPLSDVVSRVVCSALIGAPFNIASPHVCIFASIARSRQKSVRSLLQNGLRILEEKIYAEDGITLQLQFEEPIIRVVNVEGAKAVEIELSVSGDGELHAGAYPVEAFTYELPNTIQSILKKARKEQGKLAQNQRLHKIISDEDSQCRIVLNLSSDTTISDADLKFLQQRFELAWEVTKQHINNLKCKPIFEVKRH